MERFEKWKKLYYRLVARIEDDPEGETCPLYLMDTV